MKNLLLVLALMVVAPVFAGVSYGPIQASGTSGPGGAASNVFTGFGISSVLSEGNQTIALKTNSVVNWVNIQQFSPLGGTNDDTAIFQTAIYACAAANVPLYIDPLVNYTTTNLFLTNNSWLIGMNTQLHFGPSGVGNHVSWTTNCTNVNIQGIEFQADYYGMSSGGGKIAWLFTASTNIQRSVGTNRTAVFGCASSTNSSIIGCTAYNYSDGGFRLIGGYASAPQPTTPAVTMLNDIAVNCWVGFDLTNYAEYVTLTALQAENCGIGILVGSGNVKIIGSTFTKNGWGYVIPGAVNNPAHGQFVGCTFNHNSVAGYNDNAQPGFSFVGCHFDGGGFGPRITNCVGVEFLSCNFQTSDLIVDIGLNTISGPNDIHGGTVASTFAVSGNGILHLDLDRRFEQADITHTNDYITKFSRNTVFSANGGSTINYIPTATDNLGNWTWQLVQPAANFIQSTNGIAHASFATTNDNGAGMLHTNGTLTMWPDTNKVALTISNALVNGSSSAKTIDITETWNTSGTPTLIAGHVTNTASGATSYLLNLFSGTTAATSEVSVDVAGNGNFNGTLVSGGNATFGGNAFVNGSRLGIGSSQNFLNSDSAANVSLLDSSLVAFSKLKLLAVATINTNQFAVAATGWTNTNAFNCVMYITAATAATFTYSDGTNTIFTDTGLTFTTAETFTMHPSYKVVVASGTITGIAIVQ